MEIASSGRKSLGDPAGWTSTSSTSSRELTGAAQRRVLDETGLTGRFDIDLTWDPTFDAPADQRAPSDAPSVFTAVREQLGLRLEPAKARVPVLVIDAIEPPTED